MTVLTEHLPLFYDDMVILNHKIKFVKRPHRGVCKLFCVNLLDS